MADGSERGGLNYEINVTGNFEEKFARFEALLQKLETQAKVSGKSTATKASTAGTESAKAETREQQKVVSTLNKKAAVDKKILQLRNRQQVAVSKQVTNEKVLTDTVERKQKAEVAVQKVQLKTVKQSIALSKAEERIANTAMRRLEIEKAIRLARLQGATTPAQISEVTGLSTATLGKSSKIIAAQNKSLKDQERLRKQNLKIQQRQVTEAEKNRRIHRDIVSFAKKQRISLQRAAKELGVSAGKAKQLGVELNKVNDFASNFLFTFRRLVGILAIFTIARRFAGLIGNAVKEMSRFNSVLETSKISLAALLASTGEMVNANGDLVTGAEKYTASLAIAEDLQKQIRIDALGTVATYEELLSAVQAGLGPGAIAGLDVDQIRKASISIAKAASTLNVSGAGFAEEIRSIILGVGTPRTTKLLQVIGLSKANIAEAKETGTVFETIQKALESFNIATEDVRKSWSGLQSQIKDAFSTILASGSVEYFETLKSGMQGFIDSLLVVDGLSEKGIGIDENAVGAVEEISSALNAIILDFKTLVTFDALFSSLRLNFAAIGEVLKLISSFLSPIIVGFGRGVTLVAGIVAGILKLGRIVTKIVPKVVVKSFKEILAFVSAIAGVLVTWIVLTKIYNGLVLAAKTIVASISIIQTAYLLVLELINTFNKVRIAQGSIILAIQTAIAAVVNLTALVIGAIVIAIGVILWKTGLLSKVFGKLNKSLDNTESKLGKIKNAILGGTNAIFGQNEATKKLEASFKSLEDRLVKMQNATKSLLLTSAIRGEAKQVFTAITSGLEKFANDSIELKKSIDQNDATLLKKQETRDRLRMSLDSARLEDQKKNAKKRRSLFRGSSSLRRGGGLATGIDSGGLGGGDSSLIDVEQMGKKAVKVYKTLEAAESSLNATKAQGNKLLQVRDELLQKNIALIEEKVRQETISLNSELAGNKSINARFELRKTLVLEEVRHAKAAVKALALQRVELQRQEEIKQNNDRLDEKSLAAINQTIELAKEANADNESIVALEAARDKTAERNLGRRRKEESLIRTMRKDLEEMADLVVSNDWLVAMSNGFKEGAQQFIETADPIAQGFADAMQGALEDAVSSASSMLTDMFDPRVAAQDPQEVAGEILLGLTESLINTILQEFLVNMLTSFLGVQTSQQIQMAATNANTAALVTLTTAMGADTVATATNSAATTANTGGLISNTLSVIGNTLKVVLNTIWLAINAAIPFSHGGLVPSKGGVAKNFAGGGWVNPLNIIPVHTPAQGFVSGGDVRKHPRPSHISPVDTVPAWLQPGEYVIPKSRVSQYGAKFFDMIRRGSISPDMGMQHLTANIKRSRGVYGLAGGGAVGSPSPSVAASRSSTGSGGTMILPVVVANDNAMDQMIAGGIDVFEEEVNEVPGFTNQNESNS